MRRLLIQTQLSNYDTTGNFILEADSGWQMTMGRVRQMLKLVPDLHIDVMGPMTVDSSQTGLGQVITDPLELNRDLFETYGDRLRYVPHYIIPNALATRFDFDFEGISNALYLKQHSKDPGMKYDCVYINDPMHLRNFKALFNIDAKYQPKFFVHSHFIDNPECPKFPTDASLWLGQCEAALRADYNFWQCGSAMDLFFESMSKFYRDDVVKSVKDKSSPWDDGYSSEEMNSPINMKNVRFTHDDFIRATNGKIIIFVPNRIGGQGRSSDYTNCGKFMFEVLPELRKRRQDFVVIAGNPNQKFSNQELIERCGQYGYVSLVPDALTRDEFKFVVKGADISVGLYDQDSYGGTVARECVEMGCLPLWIDKYEYSTIAKESGYDMLAKPDFSDIVDATEVLINASNTLGVYRSQLVDKIKKVVRQKCSYEKTTPVALNKMGLL